MLTFVVGANGSGKSLYAMHLLIDELRFGKRKIVTTLALDMAELNDYCQRMWPNEVIDVYGRVLCIGEQQLAKYWRYRGPAAFGEYGSEAVTRGEFGCKDWDEYHADAGVLYLLDEIEVGFGTREWQKNGLEFTKYQPQHRKFSDDVYAIAPSSALVDKQYRLLCNRCVVLQNQYQLKIWLLKAPRKIVARWYLNTPPEKGEPHFQKEDIYIDGAGLAKCYKTQGGIGVCGRNADKGKESKGLPWWSIFPAGGCAAVLAWFVISRVMHVGLAYGAHALSVTAGHGGIATNVAAAVLPSVVKPAFGNEEWIRTNTGPHEKVRTFAEVARIPIAEEMGIWYGRAECKTAQGTFVVLETDRGTIEGTNLVVRGAIAELDGVKYVRARKRAEGQLMFRQ